LCFSLSLSLIFHEVVVFFLRSNALRHEFLLSLGFTFQNSPTTTSRTPNFVNRRNSDSINGILYAGTNANEMIPLKKGSTCALITPFTENGKIDVAGLEKLIDIHLEAETDNLCVLGTTAEASVMSMEERALVLTTIVNKAKGKIPLLVGTGTIDPVSVKRNTQQAIDLGADASLVVSPYYVKPPQRGLVRHFTDAADMGLPVILYNVPGRTAVNILDETIATLAEHENIVGIKDATGDICRLTSLKKILGEEGSKNFLKYSGDDGTTTDFLLEGGDGCISVTANIVPKQMHDMVHSALDGDDKKAVELNKPLALLHKRLFVESNPIPCKWAASRLGLISNAYCRPPLDVMDPQYINYVEEALAAAGLL
jgi:4-hydroxy-tetrahydrodipicolinate synthase